MKLWFGEGCYIVSLWFQCISRTADTPAYHVCHHEMKTFLQLYIKYVGVVTDAFRHNTAA